MAKHDLSREMLSIMSRQGWRITDQRRTMAQLFAEAEGYLSPKDVYDAMQVKYPGLSFDTVYRNLRRLSEMGALEQFYFMDGGLKFKANCLDHHHHHIICVDCEKTLSFDFCPMEQQLKLPGNFKISSHRFEVYGVCDECQDAGK